MIVFVDERRAVASSYVDFFSREGVSVTYLSSDDFDEWIANAPETDLLTVEAFLLGDCEGRIRLLKKIRTRRHHSMAPVLAVTDNHSLEQTLALFHEGVDDVLCKPVDVREIMARIAAICRRKAGGSDEADTRAGPIRIYGNGRDPEINGEELTLPRRERRILEYLVNNSGRRVNKSQIFSAIYGIFNDEVEENVVESHISKLRKKLKNRLGYDVIDSRRFMGYKLSLRE